MRPTTGSLHRCPPLGDSIEITGVITGAWTPIGNIVITGAERPRSSPGIGLVSAPSRVRAVDLQIYGNVGMHDEVPEHANPLNLPAADGTDGHDQILGYADYSGASEVTLDGPLSLSFPASRGLPGGYQPTLGDEFVLYFSHALDPAFGEVPGAEFVYTDTFMAALPDLLAGLPELADRSWSYVAKTGAEVFSSGQQVPEPDSLVLLATGGLILLACAGRRHRRK